jgi:hypothetical protein
MQCPENIRIAPSKTPGICLYSRIPVDLFVDTEIVELDVVENTGQDGVARQEQWFREFGEWERGGGKRG